MVEAVQNIVPILCVPIELDQFVNCQTAETVGIGKSIQQSEFEFEKVSSFLNELIANQSFKENMKKFESIMRSFKGKKRAAEIILEQAEIGCDHLIPRWKFLPWYQKNDLDIFIVYFLVVWIIYTFIKKIRARSNKPKQE